MKIKVLLVIPGMEVQKVKIPASIKFIKSFIGDDLQKYKLVENNILIANKNPKIDEFNRFYKNNMILGRFIIVSTKKNKLTSLKNRDFRRYSNMFSLKKQENKVNKYKEYFLEQYYNNQIELKRKAAKENKEKIFGIAA